ELSETLNLTALDFRVDSEDSKRRALVVAIAVDPDDDVCASVDRLLRPIGGLLDLALNEARFDRRKRSAGVVDLRDERFGLVLNRRRQALERIRAAQGVDDI